MLLSRLNRRQIEEWAAYVRLYSIGADRTTIDISHNTYHTVKAWLGKDETRLPTDFAPQFSTADQIDELSEAQSIWSELKKK